MRFQSSAVCITATTTTTQHGIAHLNRSASEEQAVLHWQLPLRHRGKQGGGGGCARVMHLPQRLRSFDVVVFELVSLSQTLALQSHAMAATKRKLSAPSNRRHDHVWRHAPRPQRRSPSLPPPDQRSCLSPYCTCKARQSPTKDSTRPQHGPRRRSAYARAAAHVVMSTPPLLATRCSCMRRSCTRCYGFSF